MPNALSRIVLEVDVEPIGLITVEILVAPSGHLSVSYQPPSAPSSYSPDQPAGGPPIVRTVELSLAVARNANRKSRVKMAEHVALVQGVAAVLKAERTAAQIISKLPDSKLPDSTLNGYAPSLLDVLPPLIHIGPLASRPFREGLLVVDAHEAIVDSEGQGWTRLEDSEAAGKESVEGRRTLLNASQWRRMAQVNRRTAHRATGSSAKPMATPPPKGLIGGSMCWASGGGVGEAQDISPRRASRVRAWKGSGARGVRGASSPHEESGVTLLVLGAPVGGWSGVGGGVRGRDAAKMTGDPPAHTMGESRASKEGRMGEKAPVRKAGAPMIGVGLGAAKLGAAKVAGGEAVAGLAGGAGKDGKKGGAGFCADRNGSAHGMGAGKQGGADTSKRPGAGAKNVIGVGLKNGAGAGVKNGAGVGTKKGAMNGVGVGAKKGGAPADEHAQRAWWVPAHHAFWSEQSGTICSIDKTGAAM
ncbi:hypothetical protein FA95DRAFT_1577564 [Auriscalpium vulgare]|uniref:Uncharacterized protein n=1 Tax=Auriscalpium vulgare TaxID=40419 RepID=A0ACB8R7F5_9AGAM|nr:hypothetical protein FA95DRAFT_1577564 [Auriscalpium vulgare]